jgi:hypothetical protein
MAHRGPAVTLAAAVEQLRADLAEAQRQARQPGAAGPHFAVQEVRVTLEVEGEVSANGEAGLRWYLVGATARGLWRRRRGHRVELLLKPADHFQVSDNEAVPPPSALAKGALPEPR